MARSVAELLPRPFAELTLEDVATIVRTVGEERETLWFERKAIVTTTSLAKACAAFANTFGGLLVVGISDGDDTIVGIEPLAAEAQLWVKDTLRAHVLPMPAFRARWLPTDDGLGVLLVLVEESSTTPHLLTRSGAIYVRNPGSSDPVPIGDQRRLLELTRRGRESLESAEGRARRLLALCVQDNSEMTMRLTAAASGTGAEFEARLFVPDVPDALSTLIWGRIVDATREGRWAYWSQHCAGVTRRYRPANFPFEPETVAGTLVERRGAVAIYRGFSRVQQVDPRALGFVGARALREEFDHNLLAAREILREFGAHGDLFLAYQLELAGSHIEIGGEHKMINDTLNVETVTDFEEDRVADRVFAEIARSLGIGPRGAG